MATFNTVDHDILLEVLHNKFGIDGNPLKWYNNYLKPRKFINKAYSTEKTMQFSIPQGSVQEAFLFIANTSTFHEVITDLTLNSFADDHSLRKAFSPHQTNDEDNSITTIERSMLEVKSWMDAVCLKLNKSKTEFIYIDRCFSFCFMTLLKLNQVQNSQRTESISSVRQALANFPTWLSQVCRKC